MAAVLTEGLKKRYGPPEALRGLDLEVPAGALFGFLGPNGAGKSTTLRILAGLVRSDAGRAELHGIDVRRHVAAAARTTFLIENAVFPPHLTARETLKRAASFLRVPADDTQLDRVGLGPARDRKTGGFSHGMRQRLGLACALSKSHSPGHSRGSGRPLAVGISGRTIPTVVPVDEGRNECVGLSASS